VNTVLTAPLVRSKCNKTSCRCYTAGVSNRGNSPTGNFRISVENLDHRLADSDCWNIDLLADFTEMIPIFVFATFFYGSLCIFALIHSIIGLMSFFLVLYTAVTPHMQVHYHTTACGRLRNLHLSRASKSPMSVVRLTIINRRRSSRA